MPKPHKDESGIGQFNPEYGMTGDEPFGDQPFSAEHRERIEAAHRKGSGIVRVAVTGEHGTEGEETRYFNYTSPSGAEEAVHRFLAIGMRVEYPEPVDARRLPDFIAPDKIAELRLFADEWKKDKKPIGKRCRFFLYAPVDVHAAELERIKRSLEAAGVNYELKTGPTHPAAGNNVHITYELTVPTEHVERVPQKLHAHLAQLTTGCKENNISDVDDYKRNFISTWYDDSAPAGTRSLRLEHDAPYRKQMVAELERMGVSVQSRQEDSSFNSIVVSEMDYQAKLRPRIESLKQRREAYERTRKDFELKADKKQTGWRYAIRGNNGLSTGDGIAALNEVEVNGDKATFRGETYKAHLFTPVMKSVVSHTTVEEARRFLASSQTWQQDANGHYVTQVADIPHGIVEGIHALVVRNPCGEHNMTVHTAGRGSITCVSLGDSGFIVNCKTSDLI